MRKKSKKKRDSEKLYLSIVNHVKKYHKLPDMGMSIANRKYYTDKLLLDGILIKKGYATYEVNWDKWEQRKFLKKVKKSPALDQHSSKVSFSSLQKKRTHGLMFRFAIPRKSNWENRRDILGKLNILYKPIGSNWMGESFTYMDWTTWLTDNSIILYTPKGSSFWGANAHEGQHIAVSEATKRIGALERLFKTSFRIGGEYRLKICRGHCGDVGNQIAKHFIANKKRVIIKDKDGEWLRIDFSDEARGGFLELETTSPKSWQPDMDKVITPFMNTLKQSPDILENIQKRMSELVELQVVQAKLNKETAAGLSSVVKHMESQLPKEPEQPAVVGGKPYYVG